MSRKMKGVSAIVLAAALWGCGSGGDEGTAVTQDLAAASTSLTLELPPASPPKGEREEPAVLAPAAAPKIEAPAAVPAPAPPSPKPLVKTEPRSEPPPPAPPAPEQVAAASPPVEVPLQQEPAAPSAVSSRPPLPEAVLARTIERIGYSCGQVVGTERVEGPRGAVYRINCSSGETFRGTTKRGRMYFRRLGGGATAG